MLHTRPVLILGSYIWEQLSLFLKATILQIAGGTGITPMLQVLDAILSNPDDNTQVCHPVVSFKPGVTLCFDGTVITVPTDHLEFVPCTV
jgi:NAD(P)H-flavin reductase